MSLSINEAELGSISEDNPLNNIIDDLYVLKSSLLNNNHITQQSSSFLSQINNLISDYPELCKNLYEWNFLENEALHFLRAKNYKTILQIITKIIQNTEKAPAFYFSKKFLFFMTEKLYFSMGGTKKYEKGGKFDVNINNILLLDEDSLPNMYESSNIDINVRLIMTFIKKLIEINRNIIVILNEIMFFELANVCLCIETAQMFNSVFVNIFFSDQSENENIKKPWIQDGLYEINRQYFGSEVFFREKDIFKFIQAVEILKSGIFKNIYDQCTNLKDFADLSFKDVIDIMLFKKIVYMSDELDLLILEGKDPKIIKFYRRALEIGAIPEKSYLNLILKMVDLESTSKDACIILYYYMDYILEPKQFSEKRVRNIIQTLEYRCGNECNIKKEINTPKVRTETKNIPNNDNIATSFDSNCCTNNIFGETCNNGLFATPEIAIKKQKTVLDNFSEFENDFNISNDEININNNGCDQYRILKLIQHIYPITNRLYFFKPSYIILFRCVYNHVISMQNFINDFFVDFINYLKSDRSNMAKLFLPVFKTEKKTKMREIRISEEYENADDILGNISNIENPTNINNFVDIKSDVPKFKVNKGIIESSESEMI